MSSLPIPEPPRWQDAAGCVDADPAAFYPTGSTPAHYAEAKAICAECPVAGPCLDFALAIRETDHGCWGGTTPAERRRMLRARGVRV